MEGLKILLTTDPEIPVPPEYYGGAERLAADLINEYALLGHEVILIANKKSTQNNVIAKYAWPSDSSVGKRNILNNAIYLRKIYLMHKPDVIHSFSRILLLYPLLFTKAVIVKRYGRLISNKSTSLAKFFFRNRIKYVCAADHMINHLNSKHHWTTVYNFVDTEFYGTKIAEKQDQLFFIGRIEEIKGVEEAIQVALALKKRLIIAGNIEPEHQEYYDKHVLPYLDDQIQYIGEVNNLEKRKYFQESLATLFPIKWEEPFGIVMAESLACGTPVIAFRRGSVPEVIRDSINGFICMDVNEMIDAVDKLDQLSSDEIREDAVSRFSRKGAAENYLSLFRDLIKKKGNDA